MRLGVRFAIGSLLALATTLAGAAPASGSPASHERFAGVWQIETPIFAVQTTAGKEPPLRPAAARVYHQHLAARKQGDLTFDNASWCASVGMPRLMLINSPFEIMVGPRHVAFMHEWNWWARIVYLKGGLLPTSPSQSAGGKSAHANIGGLAPVVNVMTAGQVGLSRGEWVGDTLVAKTDHLIDTTLIDNAGLPHSDALRLTERLRLRNPDELEDRIRFEDAATFTRPWEAVVTYRRQPGGRIHEDVCLDRIKAGEPAVKE